MNMSQSMLASYLNRAQKQDVEIQSYVADVIKSNIYYMTALADAGVEIITDNGKIFLHFNGNGNSMPVEVVQVPEATPVPSKDPNAPMEYMFPEEETRKAVSRMKRAIRDHKSINILLTGQPGTGKTCFVHAIAKKLGFAKVVQVNGSEDLDITHFLGKTAVGVDEKTSQNYTYFEAGPLVQAFLQGTVYDKDTLVQEIDPSTGEPKLEDGDAGKPAIFFLDEFAAMSSQELLGVFNRAMDLDNGKGRQIELPGKGGRVIKAHPGMVMMFAGNTVGTGTSGKSLKGFTAQKNIMDESTLSRIGLTLDFGYNLDAEREIAKRALGNNGEVEKLMRLAKELRDLFQTGKGLKRIFTTRHVISICDGATAYREDGFQNPIIESIRDVFNSLDSSDKAGWNEIIRTIYNVDFVQEEADKRKNNTHYYYC